MVKTRGDAPTRSSRKDKSDHSVVGGEEGLQVPPIETGTSKNRNPSSDSVERVGSTETLISPIMGSKGVEEHVNSSTDDVGAQYFGVESVGGGKHVKRESPVVNPSVEEVAIDSPVKSHDEDDVMVVSSSPARVVEGLGKELEKLAEKRKAAKKGKRKGDNIIPDDATDESEEEDTAELLRKRFILPERYLSDITYNNQTYIDILEGPTMLVVLADIGPHWPKMVRKFVCNNAVDIADLDSPMFHQVKLRGHMFSFSPELINKHYGRTNDGVAGATLKLVDIIEELTGMALKTWPTK
ncbi:hypothetical protein LIER_31315 [Lithospermum erythrorhizon]|uniref:Uncharacterized protein n=1 Tax=Lithospermum erythrorhizon TaxID=34254 RepID=A0AAV3RWI3_LITER